MTLILFLKNLTVLLCSGHDSNVARGGNKAKMYSQPTEIHEDLVARPPFPPVKRDEKTWEFWDVKILR